MTTAMNIYVKMVSQDATAAMMTLEANCATTVHQECLIGIAEQGETMIEPSNMSSCQSDIQEFWRRGGFEPPIRVV